MILLKIEDKSEKPPHFGSTQTSNFNNKSFRISRRLQTPERICIKHVPNNIKTHHRHISLFYNYDNTLSWLRVGAFLSDQRLVDVRYDTTSCDCGLDQAVQLFVSSDGQLQVARGDSLHLQVLTGVPGQLQHLC